MMDFNTNTTLGMGLLLLLLACILIIWIISTHIKDLIRYNNEIFDIRQTLKKRLDNGEITKTDYQELVKSLKIK